MEKETSKKYEAAVAAFIKENKPKGTVVYDDLANQLATPYTLDAEAMEKLIQKVEDAGISVVDENGDPSEHSLKKMKKKRKRPKQKTYLRQQVLKLMIPCVCT